MTTTEAPAGAPAANATTGTPYHGKNPARLEAHADALGVSAAGPVWAGYRQWLEAGRQVRRGEHGCPCLTVVTTKDGTKKPRGFAVFHITQTDPKE